MNGEYRELVPAPVEAEIVEAPDWPWLQPDTERGGGGGLYGAVLMSNRDHEVDEEVAERLRREQVRAEYTAWDFHAICWFADDGRYHAEVWCHGTGRGQYHAATPKELMTVISDIYGWE